MGLFCAALTAALIAPAFALGCGGRAIVIGGFSLLDGSLMGAALALATRTRRPIAIYACLGLAALVLWPLGAAWPPGSAETIRLPPGAPGLLLYYLDALRLFAFTLGVPYPFALLGWHAPDPRPDADFHGNSAPADTSILENEPLP